MKTYSILFGFALILFSSCEYSQPFADFSTEYNLVEPGEAVSFNNYTDNATSFEWDFGDGTYSHEMQPIHSYSREGVYNVRLAAHNGSSVDYSYLSVEVYYTTLEIQVVDYYNGELISNANVIVYANYDNYENFGEQIFNGVTDYNGIVVIKGLRAQSYYVDVYNNYYSNWGLAANNINTVITDPLEYAMHNVYTANVEYDARYLKSTTNETNELRSRK